MGTDLLNTFAPTYGDMEEIDQSRLEALLEEMPSPADWWLISHAAFPVALTSDLLYKIWVNFRPQEQACDLDSSLLNVSTILRSPICKEINTDLFEIFPAIRTILLDRLQQQFGRTSRQHDLAKFLTAYIDQCRSKIPSPAFAEAQRFQSDIYISQDAAAENLLQEITKGSKSGWHGSRVNYYLSLARQATINNRNTASPYAGSQSLNTTIKLAEVVQKYFEGSAEEAEQIMGSIRDLITTTEENNSGKSFRTSIPRSLLHLIEQKNNIAGKRRRSQTWVLSVCPDADRNHLSIEHLVQAGIRTENITLLTQLVRKGDFISALKDFLQKTAMEDTLIVQYIPSLAADRSYNSDESLFFSDGDIKPEEFVRIVHEFNKNDPTIIFLFETDICGTGWVDYKNEKHIFFSTGNVSNSDFGVVDAVSQIIHTDGINISFRKLARRLLDFFPTNKFTLIAHPRTLKRALFKEPDDTFYLQELLKDVELYEGKVNGDPGTKFLDAVQKVKTDYKTEDNADTISLLELLQLYKWKDKPLTINVETIKLLSSSEFHDDVYKRYFDTIITDLDRQLPLFNFQDTVPQYLSSTLSDYPVLHSSLIVVLFLCKETIDTNPGSNKYQIISRLCFLSIANQILLVPILIEQCNWQQTPLCAHDIYPKGNLNIESDIFWTSLKRDFRKIHDQFARLNSNFLSNKEQAQENDYAIVIGINDYTFLSPIVGSINSAHYFMDWLTSPNGGGVPLSQTIILLSSPELNIGEDEIYKAFIELFRQRGENHLQSGKLFLYFSGRCLTNISSDTIQLLLSGASEQFPNRRLDISSYVDRIMQSGFFEEVIVVVDGLYTKLANSYPEGIRPMLDLPSKMSNLSNTTKMIFIANEVEVDFYKDYAPTYESSVQGSLTRVLVEGFEGGAADVEGNITAQSLLSFVNIKQVRSRIVYDGRDFVICKANRSAKCRVMILPMSNVTGLPVDITDANGNNTEYTIRDDNPLKIELIPGLYAIAIPDVLEPKSFFISPGTKEYTIDLQDEYDRRTKWKFKDKYVLVIGTGSNHLSENELIASKEIGKQLAENGFGLITGGWPGVDNETAKSYFETLSNTQLFRDEYIAQVIVNKQIPIFNRGKFSEVSDDINWYRATSAKAMAVVLIGGKRGTSDVIKFVDAYNMPIIPIPSTGGFAANYYRNEVKIKNDNYPPNFTFNLEDEINLAMKILLEPSGNAYNKNINALFSDSSNVLVQELSGPSRWSQANFNYKVFIDFFGASISNEEYYVRLKYITSAGIIGNEEESKAVSVASSNYRFELRAARELDYPAESRPIAVFIKENNASFLYHILMPGTSGYSEVESFLAKDTGRASKRMRKKITDVRTVQKACPSLPFWKL